MYYCLEMIILGVSNYPDFKISFLVRSNYILSDVKTTLYGSTNPDTSLFLACCGCFRSNENTKGARGVQFKNLYFLTNQNSIV